MQAAYSKSATLMHKFVSVTCFLWPAEESSSELSKDARLVAFQKDIWSCGINYPHLQGKEFLYKVGNKLTKSNIVVWLTAHWQWVRKYFRSSKQWKLEWKTKCNSLVDTLLTPACWFCEEFSVSAAAVKISIEIKSNHI